MSRRSGLAIALAVGLTLVFAELHGSAQDKAEATVREPNAKARLELARGLYDWTLARRNLEPERVATDAAYQWSVRWLQAERDLSRAKLDEIRAHLSHVRRMETLKRTREEDFKGGQAMLQEVNEAEFFRLEAEDWLAAARDGARAK